MGRVALISDYSGSGKSSITSELPIFSAFGHVVSSVITQYKANSIVYKYNNKFELNDNIKDVFESWKNNNLKFEAMFTGFLGNSETISMVRDYAEDLKLDNENMLLMVSPSFAYRGKVNDDIKDDYLNEMMKLISMADIVSYNFTEICKIANVDYEDLRLKLGIISHNPNEDLEKTSEKVLKILEPLLNKIVFKRKQIFLILGIELYDGIVSILDIYDGDIKKRETTCNYVMKVEDRIGTTDMFNAVFLSLFLQGHLILDCLKISSGFVYQALRFSNDKKFPKEDGIIYEPILMSNVKSIYELLEKEKNEREEKKQNNENSENLNNNKNK